jgi:phosphatidylserine/phosphatidylglycerophosphate/cardiolipin synthase-like enzyme
MSSTRKPFRRLLAAFYLLPLAAGADDVPVPVDLALPAAIFSAGNETDRTIFNVVENLIDAVPPAESIYVNVYYYDDAGITDRLEAAAGRGVRVHVLLDGRSLERARPAVRRLRGLSEDFVDFGIESVNHNKYLLFSRVQTRDGLVDGVILQTSSNLTRSDAQKSQNAVIVGSIEIYERYRRNWIEMSHARAGQKALRVDAAPYTSGNVTLYLAPGRGADPVVEFLDAIPRDASSCTIGIAHSRWTNSVRGRRVAAALGRVASACDVEVAGRFICDENVVPTGCAGDVAEAVWGRLRDLGITGLHRLCAGESNLHSKYVLASYVEADGASRSFVLTGSPNLTSTALTRNYEALLKIDDAGLYGAYRANFDGLRESAMRPGDSCGATEGLADSHAVPRED